MNFADNLLYNTDSYKLSHWRMYEPGTTWVYSHFMSRGGRWKEVLYSGMQYIINRHLTEPIIMEDIKEAKEQFKDHFMGNDRIFNELGWINLVKKYNGFLPITIKAVPEGLPIPPGNILFSVANTDPEFAWVTNYVETMLVQSWFPSIVATMCYELRKLLKAYIIRTGGDLSKLDYMIHDFAVRGTSSMESASWGGGIGHMMLFKGSDNCPALRMAKNYYGEPCAAVSIPAAEHSTICSWGREREVEAYQYILNQFPTGPVAIVSDSYNIYNACKNIWGGVLKEQVLARDGVLVVRPDSGNPLLVLPLVLDILAERFGSYEKNGFRVLNDKVRIIQGDGVNFESIGDICETLTKLGWSTDNYAFGMGGALLQKVDRDIQEFALKCSQVWVNGVPRDVLKDPITDPRKRSMGGRLKLVTLDGAHGRHYQTLNEEVSFEKDILEEVFRNGHVMKKYLLSECRENTTKSLEYWDK